METVTVDGVRAASVDEITSRITGYLGYRLLLCGHTHIQRAVHLPDGPLIVNPGSVGWPAYDGDEPFPHVIEAGSPHARYAVIDDASGTWEAALFAVDYPWADAAATAAANGRPEVAQALMTGRHR